MVDEMAKLVKEAERNPSAEPGDAQVDRVLLAVPIRAGLADRRRRTDGNGFEVGPQSVQARCCCECTLELGHQRASAW
jgi:hypothetical protein